MTDTPQPPMPNDTPGGSYPPPPAYSPSPPPPPPFPPAPPAPARSRRKLWLVLATAGVLALCCCGGIVAVANGDDPKPKTPAIDVGPTTAATAAAQPAAAATTTAAPAPAPKDPPPKVYKGRGDKVVKIGDVSDLRIVHFVCTCSSNTVLESDGPETLMVNEIGRYNGKLWINVEEGSLTTRLTVKASGSWTITIGTVAQLAMKAPTGTASGKGDNVVVLGGSSDTVTITHRKGQSNFAVFGYNIETGQGGLLVNEIGGYSGEVELDTPALVGVHADGEWTLKTG